MTSINTRMFDIIFEVSLLVASLKISTFMNKPLFIHTREKLKFMWLHMPSLIQKHAHVKGQRSKHDIFKFQPNPSWAKKRPNRYTSFQYRVQGLYCISICCHFSIALLPDFKESIFSEAAVLRVNSFNCCVWIFRVNITSVLHKMTGV